MLAFSKNERRLLIVRVRLVFFSAAASEIPEARLVRDLIFTFQGIDGTFIKYDRTADMYRVVAEVRRCFRKGRVHIDCSSESCNAVRVR